jgi:hypothetical protein
MIKPEVNVAIRSANSAVLAYMAYDVPPHKGLLLSLRGEMSQHLRTVASGLVNSLVSDGFLTREEAIEAYGELASTNIS